MIKKKTLVLKHGWEILPENGCFNGIWLGNTSVFYVEAGPKNPIQSQREAAPWIISSEKIYHCPCVWFINHSISNFIPWVNRYYPMNSVISIPLINRYISYIPSINHVIPLYPIIPLYNNHDSFHPYNAWRHGHPHLGQHHFFPSTMPQEGAAKTLKLLDQRKLKWSSFGC